MATKCEYNSGGTGLMRFFDDRTFETLHVNAPLYQVYDFCGPGNTVVPAAGSAESGCDWVKKIVGAAPPTVGQVADAQNGVVRCAQTATSEKQNADLYWNDERSLALDAELGIEMRIKVSTLGTSNAQIVWGLAGDWADGPDAIAQNIWFKTTTSGTIVYEGDDGTTDTDDQSTGVTVANTDWKIYRIQCTGDSGAVTAKYYIDGTQVGSYTFAATSTALVLQPYISTYKASGTGVGAVDVDYVKVWANRS